MGHSCRGGWRALAGAGILWGLLGCGPVLAEGFAVRVGGRSPRAFTEEAVFSTTGFKGGLIVHLGCGAPAGEEGVLTAALGVHEAHLVQGLDTNAVAVQAARQHIAAQGRYGRVSAVVLEGTTLPYVDNLVNLVVVSENPGIACEEIARVMAPYGTLLARRGTLGPLAPALDLALETNGWIRAVKRKPPDTDEWPQYLHGADNNAVAQDTVVGPPRHLQWTTGPAWSRSHMGIPSLTSMVSARGRLFSVEDRASRDCAFLPSRFCLVARDAFNGMRLWAHDFTNWEATTRFIKSIPVQLQRRLAAIGERVYCTPGLSEAITVFDAGTGEILHVYEGTTNTQEFALHDGLLYAMIGHRMNAAIYDKSGEPLTVFPGSDPGASFYGCGFDAGYSPEIQDVKTLVTDLVAFDAVTGTERWRIPALSKYVGCTLAARGSNLVYQCAGGLFCRDAATGAERWSVLKSIGSSNGEAPNALMLTDEAVYATEQSILHAYGLADGSNWWSVSVTANYHKPPDIFHVGGAIWTTGNEKPLKSYDTRTGALLRTFEQKKIGPMGHDRCYRNQITSRYYINSKTGGSDFVGIEDGTEWPHTWVRGACGYGVLPCNGLLYSTPYCCNCSVGQMLQNMNGFSAEPGLTNSGGRVEVATSDCLVKGPAFGCFEAEPGTTNWPTHRHDNRRSGTTPQSVSATNLASLWSFPLRTPSAPTVEAGKVFVSDIDAHTVYALNSTNGTEVWRYVAGGRVDSPPTHARGLVVFGSRDGWVHCLRAADGALSWRFKGLPDGRICAFDQFESAWPVHGSVLVTDGLAYFAAGRSSFLDGGIFQFALDLRTGGVTHRSRVYGDFDSDGFPSKGYKADIFVQEGSFLYQRHKKFNLSLEPVTTSVQAHVLPSAGFLNRRAPHRVYWRFSGSYGNKTTVPEGSDMVVVDGSNVYRMRGFPVDRYSYFDPRTSGYRLMKVGGWSVNLPVATRAMVMTADTLFVAGNAVERRLAYDRSNRLAEVQAYEESYAGQRNGALLAVAKTDGAVLAEYELGAPVRWDSVAAAEGRLFMALNDGNLVCWGEEQ